VWAEFVQRARSQLPNLLEGPQRVQVGTEEEEPEILVTPDGKFWFLACQRHNGPSTLPYLDIAIMRAGVVYGKMCYSLSKFAIMVIRKRNPSRKSASGWEEASGCLCT
jgi:hypothetical protein